LHLVGQPNTFLAQVTFAVRSSVALGASFCCNATLKSAYEVSARRKAGADLCRPQHSPLANRGQLCAGEGAEPSRPC
jgi:hypothetical protein